MSIPVSIGLTVIILAGLGWVTFRWPSILLGHGAGPYQQAARIAIPTGAILGYMIAPHPSLIPGAFLLVAAVVFLIAGMELAKPRS